MVIAKSKKVKPQMTNTIKSMDYTWTETSYNEDAVAPVAIFVPHSNSLPFEERRVTLENPAQIGRNVYRATPSSTNTIFDCRVLSRHHATLHYDKGHFYLVDNRSSNGTFINSNRCSISQEQEPHEVFSGDVVQFGIPVVENASNSEKNTFPPVVALLKLFHPNGKEAKQSSTPTMTPPLHLNNLYQLNNFIQEAIQREATLESRLRTLRECVERTRAEAVASWELFVGEQRLLMRVHTLEAMLAAGKTPDTGMVVQLLNDKSNYQKVAQESLRSAHEQRLALEEALERRGREATALHHQNCALRAAANNALAELQKLASRCESKMCAARLAIAAAEERERALRTQLPLAYSVQNGEAKMLIVSSDSNKSSESRRGALEDAVRDLPDYIKLLLPQNILTEVGIKAISAEGKSAKEFELILKANNILNSESKDNFTEKQQHEEGVSGSGENKPDDVCTDDEKHSRLNHDPGHEVENSEGEFVADNNANSTYSESSNKEDSPSKASVEYANILRVMGGLNEEIKVLRERLAAVGAENEQLRGVRDELLAARDPPPPAADHDLALHQARIADLQEQLSRSMVAEEAHVEQISRLSARAVEVQAELAFRPTRADVEQLAAAGEQLRRELAARDLALARLHAAAAPRATASRAVNTDPAPAAAPAAEPAAEPADVPADISAEIDDLFRLEGDDDDDTDSALTEMERAEAPPAAADYVRLEDSARLQVTLANGSLHALEEELVRAKERWAEACEERARLALQLAAARKPPRLAAAHALALAVPLLAAALYCLLLPYLS